MLGMHVPASLPLQLTFALLPFLPGHFCWPHLGMSVPAPLPLPLPWLLVESMRATLWGLGAPLGRMGELPMSACRAEIQSMQGFNV